VPRSANPRANRSGGFVLLEILISLVIFTTVVLAWSRATDSALEGAQEANAERYLRMLTSRMMSEVLARPEAFAEGDEGGFEEETAPGEENPFAGYAWSVEVEPILLTPSHGGEDDEAGFLFEEDEDAPAPTETEGGKTPPGVQVLRCTLVVRWVDSEPEKQMRAIFFIPDPEAEEGGDK
jgi:type II secretory pathway pseudopilin PulG